MTVFWSGEGATLVCWRPSGVEGPQAEGSTGLPAGAEAGMRYREKLAELLDEGGHGKGRVWWILLEEPWRRHLDPGTGTDLLQLPGWMEAAWAGLPVRELPERVLSATACLEAGLRRWPEFRQPGTGIRFQAGGRCLFFALAGEDVHKRISRGVEKAGEGHSIPDGEWMAQTRMLYRSRTGRELKRILVPGGPDSAGKVETGAFLCAGDPPGWGAPWGLCVGSGEFYIHACAIREGAGPGCVLSVPGLERRKHQGRREALFRSAACVLLGTWMLVLLAACHSLEGGGEEEAETLRQWRHATDRLRTTEARWRAIAEREARESAPYRMIGGIASTMPPPVSVSRIRVGERGKDAGEGLSVLVNGTCSGGDASGIFHEWITRLREKTVLTKIENLRFEPEGTQLRFHLEGYAKPKGP